MTMIPGSNKAGILPVQPANREESFTNGQTFIPEGSKEVGVGMKAGDVLFFGGLPKGTTHMKFPSNVLHYQEVQVHGSYASRHRDQVHALDMLAGNLAGIRRVVTDVVALDAAPDAFERIRAGEVLKAVVTP